MLEEKNLSNSNLRERSNLQTLEINKLKTQSKKDEDEIAVI